MEDFEIEIKSTFLDEARALLEESEEYYMSLEDRSGDTAVLDAIFRNAHSLKGGSKGAGFKEIELLTHSLEGLLFKIKEGSELVTNILVSLLLKVNDTLRQQVEALTIDFHSSFDPQDLIDKLENYCGTRQVEASDGFTEEIEFGENEDSEEEEDYSYAHRGDDSYSEIPEDVLNAFEGIEEEEEEEEKEEEERIIKDEVQVEKISDEIEGFHLFGDDEQEFSKNFVLGEKSPAKKEEPLATVTSIEKNRVEKDDDDDNSGGDGKNLHDEKIRVSLSKIENLINSVGEMVILHSVLHEEAKGSKVPILQKTVGEVGKIVKEVQDVSMGLRMVPIKQVFKKMQRIIRDSALDLGKKVNFHLVGEEVEVDKTVLDQIGDPLVHITRNAVDHGIEFPEERLEAGKSEYGEVTLSAYHESGRLVISMVDDGRGIDPEKIRKKAIEKKIINATSKYSDTELMNLVFHAGFSTKEQVTAISGRGVGMDVVKTNIENLSGEINITSKVGYGSELKISLPLTLAIIDGMTIRVGEKKFVIPLSNVLESVRVTKENIRFITGLGDVLLLRGDNLPVVNLAPTLEMPECELSENPIAIVVQLGERAYAILVDDILARSQVVIKQLGSEIRHLKGFSGSTILGDGKPSLILEVPDVIAMHKPSLVSIFGKPKKVA